MRFPPLLPRRRLETTGYLESFPHLAARVFSFEGTEAQALEQDERRQPARGLGRIPVDDRPGPVPGGLLPRLPGGRRARPAPAGGATVDAGSS